LGYVKWIGHAAFEVELDGLLILIDPWIEGNPSSCYKLDDVRRADYVLVTHDHSDHMGDSIEICKKTGACFVSTFEVAEEAASRGVERVVGLNVGGVASLGGLRVVVTPALHSSIRGTPCGFIVIGEEGSVYHAGDTGLFYDISLYAKLYPIDVALVPIGGYYTMDPLQAAEFVSLARPEIAVPMHYGTFPQIEQKPEEFAEFAKARAPGVRVEILKPGEVLML